MDALEEATSLVREAAGEGIPVRIVGGLAVRFLTPGFPPRSRDDQDLDLCCTSGARTALTRFLADRGFEPDRFFNNLHGHKQLFFRTPDGRRSLDVMVDRLDMCHELDLRDRIELAPVTLDPTDLLLSKLQIVELNEKDLKDALYLLAGLPVRDGVEPGAIGLDRFGEIVGQDWGWWRTVTGNLDRIAALSAEELAVLVPPATPFDPVQQARLLRQAADTTSKSLKWKLRARVGERILWYKLPEEVHH